VERSRFADEYRSPAVLGGARSEYSANNWKTLDPTGTPFFYTALGWIWSGDYETDYRRLHKLSFLVFFFGLVAFGSLWFRRVEVAALLLASTTPIFLPYMLDIKIGNVHRLITGALAFYLFLRGKASGRATEIFSGFFLLALTIFKPITFFAFVLVVLTGLFQRRWIALRRQGVGFLLAIACALLGSRLTFGSFDCWVHWLNYLIARSGSYSVDAGNYGLTPLIREYFGVDPFRVILPLSFTGAALTVYAIRKTELSTLVRETSAISLGLLVYILSATLVWSHYFTLTLLPLIWLLRGQNDDETERWRTIRWVLASVGGLLVGLDLIRVWFRPVGSYGISLSVNSGAALLFFLLIADFIYTARAVSHRNEETSASDAS
jgi:hypothetical protein